MDTISERYVIDDQNAGLFKVNRRAVNGPA